MSLSSLDVDIIVDAIKDHLALIKQQNDHIAQLTTKINERFRRQWRHIPKIRKDELPCVVPCFYIDNR